MVTLRLHLSPAGPENGAPRVIPGSHNMGRLRRSDIARLAGDRKAVTCTVGAGGAVMMRPLLVHSSLKSKSAAARPVIHIEYSPDNLPAPLEWRR